MDKRTNIQSKTHLDVWHPALGVCSHKQHRQNADIPKQGTARFVDAPWYYHNEHLRRDLKVPTSRQEIQRFAEKHERRLHSHANTEVLQLLDKKGVIGFHF
jgi:hypothetical protein